MLLLQKLQISNFITPQPCDHILPTQQIRNLLTLLPKFLQSLKYLLPFLRKAFRRLLHIIQITVQTGHIIRHVCLLKQLIFRFRHLLRIFLFLLLCHELQEGEDQMAIEMGDEAGQEVIFAGDFFGCLCLGLRAVQHCAC